MILGTLPSGFSHHGNSRGGVGRELASAGTLPAGTSHHGNSRDFKFRNRPPPETFPWEPATTGNLPAGSSYHENSRDLCKHPPRPGRWPRQCSYCWPALCLRGWGVGALKPHAQHGPFWSPSSAMAFRCGDVKNVVILYLYY